MAGDINSLNLLVDFISFKLNALSHSYQLDQSISVLKVVG